MSDKKPSSTATPSTKTAPGTIDLSALLALPAATAAPGTTSTSNPSIITRYGTAGHQQTTWALDEAKGGKEPTTSTVGAKAQKASTLSDLLAAFTKMPEAEYLTLRNKLIAAGVLSASEADPYSVRKAYASVLADVADMQSTSQHVTPGDYVDSLVSLNGIDPDSVPATATYNPKASASSSGNGTRTVTTVYDMSPDDARASLEQHMAQLLGRDPTDAELHDFINAAQYSARNNPASTTNTTTTDANGVEHEVDTTSHAGFDENSLDELAEDKAKAAPDYGSYQAASLYFPAMTQALGATTGGS